MNTPVKIASKPFIKTLLTRWSVCLIAGLTACFTAACIDGTHFMNKPDRSQEFFKGHYLLMAHAIERNDMGQLRQLARDQDLTLKGDKDMDLLWFAIARENFDAIRTLVELGVNPDKQLAQGVGSALQLCFMKHDDTRYLQAMLDGGLSPNHQRGDSLLLQRAVFGGLEHVKLLLQHGAHMNDQDSIGYTALDEAISSRKPDIALYLVQQGADFNTYTVNGASTAWAVHLAINGTRPGTPVHNKFLELRDLMIEKGVQWPPAPPDVVREQMRTRGETPVVPRGQTR